MKKTIFILKAYENEEDRYPSEIVTFVPTIFNGVYMQARLLNSYNGKCYYQQRRTYNYLDKEQCIIEYIKELQEHGYNPCNIIIKEI